MTEVNEVGRAREGGDPAGDGAWPLLAVAVQDLSRVLRGVGERAVGLDPITGSEHEVLRCVSSRPGRTVSAVSRSLGQQPSNVSTTVRSLVGRGLVERRTDPADRRRVSLHPTARALEHRALLDAAWSRALERALAGLPEGDAGRLRAAAPALGRLVAALDPEGDHRAFPPG